MSPRPFLVASRTCLPRVPIGSSGGCRLPSDPSPACERPWPRLRAHAVTSFPFRAGPDAPSDPRGGRSARPHVTDVPYAGTPGPPGPSSPRGGPCAPTRLGAVCSFPLRPLMMRRDRFHPTASCPF